MKIKYSFVAKQFRRDFAAKSQSSEGLLSKNVLKKFVQFTENVFVGACPLIKLQPGNLKLSEAAIGDVLLKKGAL